MKQRIAIALATGFGIGDLPKAPGTWASLAALPLAWIIQATFGMFGLLAAAIAMFAIGWWASSIYVAWTGAEDPAPVVIDEVAGQWLTLVLADPDRWWLWLLGFAAFRLFDIVKPWPVSWADRNVRGGLGVMLDDFLAGPRALALSRVWPVGQLDRDRAVRLRLTRDQLALPHQLEHAGEDQRALLPVAGPYQGEEAAGQRPLDRRQEARGDRGDGVPRQLQLEVATQPVAPGEAMDIAVRLDDIAYQVPAGHRLRVAVSSTYWPLVWPSPRAVVLTLFRGELDIPERPVGSGDEAHFEEPERYLAVLRDFLRRAETVAAAARS